jgi:hypothetical protein
MGMEIKPKVRWPFQTVVAIWTLLGRQPRDADRVLRVERQARGIKRI